MRRLRRPSGLPFTALALICGACGTFRPLLSYRSHEAVPRADLRVDVRVEILPAAPIESGSSLIQGEDEPLMRRTFRDALTHDLDANGPFTFDPVRPDAILELRVVPSASGTRTSWWWIPPFFFASYLVGAPTYARTLSVTLHARLLDPGGALFAEATFRESCTRYSGPYYGYSVDFACAAAPAVEALRAYLSEHKSRLVALVKRARHDRGEMRTQPTPVLRPGDGPVVAVFDIETDPGADDALKGAAATITDYFAAKVAERGYRVVPRAMLRGRILEAKAETHGAWYEESGRIELGRALAAQVLLHTQLLRLGDACAMTATLFDLATETTARAATARTECSERGFLRGVDELAERLGGAPFRGTDAQ